MSKKLSKDEAVCEFRDALATNFSEAEKRLKAHPDLIDYPVYGKSETALQFFSTENRSDIVAWLVEKGANLNGIADNDSPLLAASQLGHLKVCRILLAAGADPNFKDSSGETALHKASGNGHLDVLDLLLSSGADPTIAEMCGELAIDQALPRKSDEVRELFERRKPPENQNK